MSLIVDVTRSMADGDIGRVFLGGNGEDGWFDAAPMSLKHGCCPGGTMDGGCTLLRPKSCGESSFGL